MPNEKEKKAFLQKLNDGTATHAYIIEGEKGVGKKEFALWCASALLCTGADKPCGVCPACRKLKQACHPDLHLYGDGDKAVSIGDVRSLIKETGLVPVEGERMVFILCEAQKMLAPAQNALLKIFEEPPAGVVTFLLTDSLRSLLPTVRSRGQKITLGGMDDETLTSVLKGKFPRADAEEIKEAVRASYGSPGAAEAFLQQDAEKDREKAGEWLEAAFAGDKYRLIGTVAVPKYKRENLLPLLDTFLRMLADLLRAKAGAGDGGYEPVKSRATKRVLAGMVEATVKCRENIESNGNITAVMTRFATELWMCAG